MITNTYDIGVLLLQQIDDINWHWDQDPTLDHRLGIATGDIAGWNIHESLVTGGSIQKMEIIH